MISTTMDIWLDSARYDRETLSDLRDNLVRVFNLPTHQADTLVNGNAHRIKRACSQEEAEKLTKQFASWGIELRIEASTGKNPETLKRQKLAQRQCSRSHRAGTVSRT